MVTVHKNADTIQGRKLFKDGKYLRKYGIYVGNWELFLLSFVGFLYDLTFGITSLCIKYVVMVNPQKATSNLWPNKSILTYPVYNLRVNYVYKSLKMFMLNRTLCLFELRGHP